MYLTFPKFRMLKMPTLHLVFLLNSLIGGYELSSVCVIHFRDLKKSNLRRKQMTQMLEILLVYQRNLPVPKPIITMWILLTGLHCNSTQQVALLFPSVLTIVQQFTQIIWTVLWFSHQNTAMKSKCYNIYTMYVHISFYKAQPTTY